ncbi:hypothetical protein ACQ4LE_008944 [Meloidogyne hapla]|uniref:SPRY domain-containing protein n=1 Tax=Meloidogyne hapla TaxID=6305 RepID=A0A1I8B4X6_MELHA
MTERGLSNSDLELNQKLLKQSDDFIKLQTNFEEKEKNISLENEMQILKKEMNNMKTSFDKKIDDLTLELEKLNNLIYKKVIFIQIKNKWEYIDNKSKCCYNNCINTNKPLNRCIDGNGFINLINKENIKYINCIEGKGFDNSVLIYSENLFKKPKEDLNNYSLFYFEIKTKIEEKRVNNKNSIEIGLFNLNNDYSIKLIVNDGVILNEKGNEEFNLPEKLCWNKNDNFGCGLIYPPINKINELPYLFFTQNGKEISKSLLLKDCIDFFKPCIALKCCSVETNFGNNLKEKPFIYDIKLQSFNFVHKEFY